MYVCVCVCVSAYVCVCLSLSPSLSPSLSLSPISLIDMQRRLTLFPTLGHPWFWVCVAVALDCFTCGRTCLIRFHRPSRAIRPLLACQCGGRWVLVCLADLGTEDQAANPPLPHSFTPPFPPPSLSFTSSIPLAHSAHTFSDSVTVSLGIGQLDGLRVCSCNLLLLLAPATCMACCHACRHMFSCHDTTIFPMLLAMGAFDGRWPPYASDLCFELYRDEKSVNDHYVRVLYMGQPLQLPLSSSEYCPFSVCLCACGVMCDVCVKHTRAHSPTCPLSLLFVVWFISQTFSRAMAAFIPDNFQDACKVVSTPTTGTNADKAKTGDTF